MSASVLYPPLWTLHVIFWVSVFAGVVTLIEMAVRVVRRFLNRGARLR